jgi:hypothetical protein
MITYTIILNGRRHDISLNKDEIKFGYLNLCNIYKAVGRNKPSLFRYVKFMFHNAIMDLLLIEDL